MLFIVELAVSLPLFMTSSSAELVHRFNVVNPVQLILTVPAASLSGRGARVRKLMSFSDTDFNGSSIAFTLEFAKCSAPCSLLELP